MTVSGLRVFLVVQLLILSASILIRAASAADVFTPPPSCIKPTKPLRFTSEWEVDQFMSSVEVYKSCIAQFVGEHREAARKHQEAANQAIEEWNDFASSTGSRGTHAATRRAREQLKVGTGDHGQR
jgi:hypothetical protein